MNSLTHSQGSTNFATYAWTYDEDSQVKSFSNTEHTDENIDNYSYDTSGQLTGVNYASAADSTYAYDANGNRTNSGDSTSANNQLESDDTYTYKYDNNGNLIKRTATDGSYTVYGWDFRNRLVSVADYTIVDDAPQLQHTVVYAYDAFDRLIGRQVFEGTSTTASTSQHFVYDGEQIVETLSDNGTFQNRYLWGPEVDQLLAQEDSSNNVLWALGDNLNSVRDYASHNATTGVTTVVDHAQYDAFGNRLNSSSVDAVIGWTGRYRDPVTGLQYNWKRWLDTSTGRWLSSYDPAWGDPNNPYRYVGNSPANWIDPLGLAESGWQPTVTFTQPTYTPDLAHRDWPPAYPNIDKAIRSFLQTPQEEAMFDH